METILELEAARMVCIRKLELLNHSSTKLAVEKKEEWEPGKREKFTELMKLKAEWEYRLQTINGKLYDLVEKEFPIPSTGIDTQKVTVN